MLHRRRILQAGLAALGSVAAPRAARSRKASRA